MRSDMAPGEGTPPATGAQIDLELALWEAVARGDVSVMLQPEVELLTGRVLAFEALARWTRGDVPVPPNEFVRLAEQSGFIGSLGKLVMAQALDELATWRAYGHDASISVNLSAWQLADPQLTESVRRLLAQRRLRPSALCLEIRESVLTKDVDLARRVVDQVKGLGITVAIDDFGTRSSSLAQLERLAVDVVKIDPSLIAALSSDRAESTDIGATAAIVEAAHRLGARTIAEGVETEEQLEALREMGCDLGQGFLWSPAVDGPAARRILEEPATLYARHRSDGRR